MTWLTEEMNKTLRDNINILSHCGQNEFGNRRYYPIISRTHDFDGEFIERADGSKEFIREPQFGFHKEEGGHISFSEKDWKELGKSLFKTCERNCTCGASRYPDILNCTCNKPFDFTTLNNIKNRSKPAQKHFIMKMEALNKANQLSAKVKDLQDHKRQMEACFETEKKEPKFKLAVSSQSYNTQSTRQELIPAGFVKQYLANIDKAIKSLEREIEKL